ncbi:Starch-binding associating with outer membrane [Sphingobacterium nematocida]|uniref:Starch-binding associating with outer membrane n=1 Tax=Sphingobacterium nematocida TaxID=1513896 RepID=A0A1T5D8Y1_9SPHI|nr:SusD/RagB family nutrient-binding outer membrane lipoprotein [Sphingobacterium nematocida]SKB68135.1 Starch-binding associating with outer membrane [Sphingobacterium nematocida]
MKKISYILSALLILGFTSCDKWLDVNENPSQANDEVPTPDLRLRSIQMQFVDAYESSGTRASWMTQNITKVGGSTNNDLIARWDFPLASTTWPYQAWFVYTAGNLDPMIRKATEEEAWHYVGAAQLIHAWGFMLMLDLYGEMPYTNALGTDVTPAYDDGKTIFYGCLDMLEKAIENLSKQQNVAATPLTSGDIWNGGDPQKWIKLAYGLKARWLNNLTKKSFYDPDAVLAALEKAPQSIADNTTMDAINTAETSISGIVRSMQFGNLGSTNNKVSKWYTDLLTNTFTGGSGVEDPRAKRIVPSAEFYNATTGLKEWRLSKGVDLINSNIRTSSGPVAYEIMATRKATTTHPSGYVRAGSVAEAGTAAFTNRWFTTNATAARQGDSVYVSVYSDRLDWIAALIDGRKDSDLKNDYYLASRYNGMTRANPNFGDKAINVNSTGSFYIRADAPAHLLAYHEMCFIKAEALFRKGDPGNALTAYKEGIRAHMEAMNLKLKSYDQTKYGKQVISGGEIDAFLASKAVAQSAGELTMAKIMQQKQIAMSLTMQNWNDMRRFNYSANDPKYGVVYPDFGRPFEVASATALECYPGATPADVRYWPRRIQQCSHERNYNSENWLASNPEANKRSIISVPVWWDIVE